MAPTICVPELSMHDQNGAGSYIRRRQRTLNNGIVREQQRLEIKRIFNHSENNRLGSLSPPPSPVWEPTCPISSFYPTRSCLASNARTSSTDHLTEHWRSFFAQREGLLDIVARTMILVRRNHMLQKRVNALRSETREFIRSVMSNPENSSSKPEKPEVSPCLDTAVSSNFEVFLSRPTPPPTPDSSTGYSTMSVPSVDNDGSSDCSSDDYYEAAQKVTQDPKVSSS
ncbi:uncharacterized protein LOC124299959 [Neodiprion virginianus]|uniref:uncharacterized protein LOC124299959 n=1 Tax=Neodiprion virginianus TaxID=2961670 RepID=UPI001EE6C88B|nr:uncharacterized protein LOC124299959 [Neodiprion virginianus]